MTKEFNEEKDPVQKARKAFVIGESYRKFNDLVNAEKWYKQAVDLKGPEKALYELGMVQKQQEKYEEAYKTFDEYQKTAGTGFEGRRQMTQCVDAVDWKKAFTKLQIKNLEELNTPNNDYGLVPYKSTSSRFLPPAMKASAQTAMVGQAESLRIFSLPIKREEILTLQLILEHQ